MQVVECLRAEINSGNASYPVYVGFLSAAAIATVAEAPAFTRTTEHRQIASNVSTQPVNDWQRPLDAERTDGIAHTFNNSGGLMPNPILLAQNAFVNGTITILAKTISGAIAGTYEVRIDDSGLQQGKRPLWILDGQHRVAGLAKSQQKDNPVPVVFLLDDGSGAYTPPLLASLFAQVTTSATKLDDLHNEWLTYAFNLGTYNPSQVSFQAEKQSFEAVIELCKAHSYSGQANPFFNAIQFNEHLPVGPAHGGFSYKCTALKGLLFRYYYNQPLLTGQRLAPAALAEQIALAYSALWAVIGAKADDSVFFGTPASAKQQTIMHDAFISGVLARLLAVTVPTNWQALLQALMFHQSDWYFASWSSGNLSGPDNTASKKIAVEVLSEAMSTGALPPGSNNIPDHLRGNGATVVLQLSELSAGRRAKKQGRQNVSILRGSTLSANATQHPHIKICNQSSNIGKLAVADANRVGQHVYYGEIQKTGLILGLGSGLPNPLELVFMMTHYGGQKSQAELRITW